MMISTTHDETQNNRLRWKSYTIRILAAAFWILVWQLASMWLKQEILLASPVSVVKKLWQFLPQADFWKTVGFSFVRIVSGFLLGLFAGTILAAAACGCKVLEILLAPVVTVMKSVPVASFIILCLIWLPSRNLSVFITFLMVFPAVYTNVCQGIRETDRELLEMAQVFQVSFGRKVRYIYISQAGTGALLESRSRCRGDRDSRRIDRGEAVSCKNIFKYTGSFCMDHCDYRDQRFV